MSSKTQRESATPAGGMATPPADPPAASGTPRRGQEETKLPQNTPANEPLLTGIPSLPSEELRPAFEFGWQSYLQHGRAQATEQVTFDSVEQELAHKWQLAAQSKNKELPWEMARETARDAWNLVHDALASGSQPKPSAK